MFCFHTFDRNIATFYCEHNYSLISCLFFVFSYQIPVDKDSSFNYLKTFTTYFIDDCYNNKIDHHTEEVNLY